MLSSSKYILITTMLTLSVVSYGQNRSSAYGNAERARNSSHHTDKDLRSPKAHLGYIDVDHATLPEFMDNLEVGLTAVGNPNLKLVSYRIVIMPKLQDIRESEKIMGSKIPRTVFDKLHMADLKSGDIVSFEDIFIEQNDRAVRKMGNVQIKID